jgi:hypothetical protein
MQDTSEAMPVGAPEGLNSAVSDPGGGGIDRVTSSIETRDTAASRSMRIGARIALKNLLKCTISYLAG